MSTPHPNTILFARGTLARLALWPTLRLAVHASWGGPASAEKQRWLASVLVDQFEPFILAPPLSSTTGTAPAPPPDAVYVEDLLLQIMLFGAVSAGDETFVKALEAQAERVKETMPAYEMGVGSGSESGSGSEWEDEDGEGGEESEGEPVPQLLNHSEPRTREEPQVDEDGFTMVKNKGRR
ncbi:hypothetical protein J3R82DRAFT_3742 [Butyriboletus roseoflavus]|nr:hypothetical protein J3R82DRAFT_3742 [Butyriboletus roseoflavus]